MIRASCRSSIQELGQSDTETSNAARATMRLLRRPSTSCPAVSILTILKRNSPNSVILESDRTGTRSQSGSTRRNLCPESTFGEPLFSWLGVPPRRLLPRSQMFRMMGPPILPNPVGQSRSHTDRLRAIGASFGFASRLLTPSDLGLSRFTSTAIRQDSCDVSRLLDLMNWIFSTTPLFYGGQKTNGSAPKHASLPNLSCRGGGSYFHAS